MRQTERKSGVLVIPGMDDVMVADTACLHVDCQKGFTPLCPDELPVPGGHEIVPELMAQADKANYLLCSKDSHPLGAKWIAISEKEQLSQISGYPNLDIRWKPHCISGTRGHELLDGLPKTYEYDFIVNKGVEPDMHPYGACFQDLAKQQTTGLIEYLRSRGVKCVIVGGLATDYCVRETVIELLNAHFDVVVNLAACRGIHPGTTRAAINEMRMLGAVTIDDSSELKLVSSAAKRSVEFA